MLDYLDGAGVQDLVGMKKNSVLEKAATYDLSLARQNFDETGQTCAVFGHQFYSAQSWTTKCRVIHKAEVVSLPGREPRDNA
ncbi:hypothetical protein CSB20_05450 [bacterium DOLZORAL124_64_63]|nr:MAG: hypothetical protein CSB20_05450 [bacterium DOLZORAL124_64_63]